MFCSEPADGDVETQRGKIESDPRNGQEHDCHLLGAGGQNQGDRRWRGQRRKTDARSLAWDSAAYKVVNDYTNDITTMKNGKVMWTGHITVAKDGKSRTVTVNGTDANGKKFTSKSVYDKA